MEQAEFKSPYLKKLHDQLSSQSGATQGIKELHQIGEAVNLRYNILLYWAGLRPVDVEPPLCDGFSALEEPLWPQDASVDGGGR